MIHCGRALTGTSSIVKMAVSIQQVRERRKAEESAGERRACTEVNVMPNAFTTMIGILLLVLIILAVRYILMHGSRKGGGCTGDCGGCGMGCASRFSPERKQFEEIMKNRKKS